MSDINELINLAKQKHQIDLKRDSVKYIDPNWILNHLTSEIEEVKQEIKPDNIPFLEDELADILWNWMMMVEILQGKEYIGSHEDIIKRAIKKYEERISPLNGNDADKDIWSEVKARQKLELKKEQRLNQS